MRIDRDIFNYDSQYQLTRYALTVRKAAFLWGDLDQDQ